MAHFAFKDAALTLLNQHNLPDPSYAAGTIESIYFDDALLSCYEAKANGDRLKHKVRIRWYPESVRDSDPQITAFLEIKNRIGAGRDKQRHRFLADKKLLCGSSLNDPALVHLLYEQATIAGFALSFGFMPSISISYHRYRFLCPVTGSRICLDSSLRSNRVNDLLIPLGRPLNSDLVVCEAKSSTHRAWSWNDSLWRLGFRLQSFSKYGEFMKAQLNKGK